jgi:hypothetical protein
LEGRGGFLGAAKRLGLGMAGHLGGVVAGTAVVVVVFFTAVVVVVIFFAAVLVGVVFVLVLPLLAAAAKRHPIWQPQTCRKAAQ